MPLSKIPVRQTIVPMFRVGHAKPGQASRDGEVRLALAVNSGGKTVVSDLFQSQPLRLLFPFETDHDVFQAVIACVSGGLVGGDRLHTSLTLQGNARAMVIGQAAEKVYRSLGPDSTIENRLEVGPGASLEWLPQETILFDGARLRRRTTARVHQQGHLLAGEILAFGRAARGENLTNGLVHDGWELRDDSGTLIWKDALHMEGDLAALLGDPARFGGACAYGTIVYMHGSAQTFLAGVREALAELAGPVLRAGATMVRDILLIRFLGQSAIELRNAYAAVWSLLRQQALGLPGVMPRLWAI